jgi:hypothetical protein
MCLVNDAYDRRVMVEAGCHFASAMEHKRTSIASGTSPIIRRSGKIMGKAELLLIAQNIDQRAQLVLRNEGG